MLDAILWDVDGTFALTEDLHFEGLIEVSRLHGADTVSAELQSQLVGQSALASYEHLVRHCGLQVEFSPWALQRYHYYRDRATTIVPRPGALAVWQTLETEGYRQGLVSNSDRLLVDINIKALGLDRPRLISVSRNDVRRGKPDPEPYLRAAHLLDVDPRRCAAVEDTPSGASAALAAGMLTVIWPEHPSGQNPGLNFPSGGVIINDIAELVNLVTERRDSA